MHILLAVSTIAAAALFFVFNVETHKKNIQVNDLAKIDKAFHNLNAGDQAYLLDVYQNDIFLNDN